MNAKDKNTKDKTQSGPASDKGGEFVNQKITEEQNDPAVKRGPVAGKPGPRSPKPRR